MKNFNKKSNFLMQKYEEERKKTNDLVLKATYKAQKNMVLKLEQANTQLGITKRMHSNTHICSGI